MKLTKKNKLLITSLILGLFVSYELAISRTIFYYRQYSVQKDILENKNNYNNIISKLLDREKQLSAFLSGYEKDGKGSDQTELLKTIDKLSMENNLKIIDFRQPHLFSNDKLITSSYIFSVEGSFNGTLLLVNDIENIISLGTIKHVNFVKKRNYKTNSDFLTTQIILQKNDSKQTKQSTTHP